MASHGEGITFQGQTHSYFRAGLMVMNERECNVTLGEAAVGSQLSRPVVRADGQVLSPPGVELNEAAVRQLLRHGVQSVWVLQRPLEPASPVPNTPPTSALDRLEYLFRHLGDEPSERFLFDVVRRYRQGDAP